MRVFFFYASSFPPTHEGRMHRLVTGCFCNSQFIILLCDFIEFKKTSSKTLAKSNLELHIC